MDELNVELINLADMEDVIIAKVNIDKYLYENGLIDKRRTSLDDFMLRINPNYVYIYNSQDSVPFGIYDFGDTKYITYVEDSDSNNLISVLNKLLVKINYDINNLKEVNSGYIIEHNIEHLIIIDRKYYILG